MCCSDRKQAIARDEDIDCHKMREKRGSLSGETQQREDLIQKGTELQEGRYD
jgi:hypothetical protein